MKTKKSHEGYLLIDHRASPGITPDQIPSGIAVPICGEGQLYESATITCSHCQATVILNPQRTRPRNYCAKCDHYVCDKPGCIVECTPFKAILDTLANAAAHSEGPIQAPEQLNRILSDPNLIIKPRGD